MRDSTLKNMPKVTPVFNDTELAFINWLVSQYIAGHISTEPPSYIDTTECRVHGKTYAYATKH